MPYATPLELKLRLKRDDVLGETVLLALLNAATLAVDRLCNRIKESSNDDSNGMGFVADSIANTRVYIGSGLAVQRIDECTSVTLVEVKEAVTEKDYTEWESDDWMLAAGSKKHPIYDKSPYTLLVVTPWGDQSHFTSGKYTGRSGFTPDTLYGRQLPTVRSTAKWGYAASAPTPIREATIMQAIRWCNRLKGGMSDTLASAELGQLTFTRQLDPDIAMILYTGRWVRVQV